MKHKHPFTTGPAETPPVLSRRTALQPLGKASGYVTTDFINIELEQVKSGFLGKFLQRLIKPFNEPRAE